MTKQRRVRPRCLLWTALAAVAGATLLPALAHAQTVTRYLYVGRAPKNKAGFTDDPRALLVYKINSDGSHALVRSVGLPANVNNIRGMSASAATGKFYIAHYGTSGGTTPTNGGWILCLDLNALDGSGNPTFPVVWHRQYAPSNPPNNGPNPPSTDRMALTPDGSKIYMPAGEERGISWNPSYNASKVADFWAVINAATGAATTPVLRHASRPHNTICSLDGQRVFLQAFGDPSQDPDLADQNTNDNLTLYNGFLDDNERSIAVYNTASGALVRKVGPFREKTRPFTVNGKASLVFATVNDFIGFQVGDVATGAVLHTARPPAGTYPFRPDLDTFNATYCHGIAQTADERYVCVVDQGGTLNTSTSTPDDRNIGIHVFDTSGLPDAAPQWVKFIPTRRGDEVTTPGGQPGWIMSTIRGDYLYPETCEIIRTSDMTVTGQLRDAAGDPVHSRFALEVDRRDDTKRVTHVGDQFGVGRATVRITTPFSGQTFVAGSGISVEAAAFDTYGPITRMDLYVNNVRQSNSEEFAPYQFGLGSLAAGVYTLQTKAVDATGLETVSVPVRITVQAAGKQRAAGFTLINADTDQPVAGYDPLPDGAILNLRTLPTRNLNIRVNTDPDPVGSVRVQLNSGSLVENGVPYSVAGDNGTDFLPWTPAVGAYTLTATPFTGANAGGTTGAALTIRFQVTD